MGEYWKPINITKRQLLHPHKLDCGMKLGEWNYAGSTVLLAIDELLSSGIWSKEDELYALSEYGNIEILQTGPTPPFISSLDGDLYYCEDISNLSFTLHQFGRQMGEY